MIRCPVSLSLLCLAGLLSAARADARFIGQEVRGVNRICAYENLGGDRSRNPRNYARVGRGEPCPFRYRAPPRRVQSTIPPLAVLESQGIVGGERVCTYVYLGVRYSRAISAAARCPATPYFF